MRRTQFLKSLSLLALLFLFASNVARAQSIVTGAISGTVTDSSGAIITEAKVTLINESTQETQSVSTNQSGVFQFLLLIALPVIVLHHETAVLVSYFQRRVRQGVANSKLQQ